MKTYTFITYIIRSSIITTILFFFIGCSKESTSHDINVDGESVALSISPAVEDFVDNEINPMASANPAVMKSAIQEKYGEFAGLTEGKDFDVAMFVKNNNPVANSNKLTASNKLENKVYAKMASVPLEKNIAYRVYIKNRTTGQWQTKVFTSGSTSGQDTIQINKNHNYDWIAVSFNTLFSNDIPSMLNATRTGFTSALTVNNKDFLYAKGELLSGQLTANRRLGIVFQHKTARVQVRMDFRGVFMNMQYQAATDGTEFNTYTPNSLSITNDANSGNVLSSGNFNLETGQYISHSAINGTNPTTTMPLTGHVYSDRKDFNFYSTQPVLAKSVTITTGPLLFSKLPNTESLRYSYTSRTLTINGSGSGANNITANLGGNAKINFFFIEPGFKSGTGTTRWAKANLMYRGTASTDSEYNRYIIRTQSAPGYNSTTFDPDPNAAGSYISSAVAGVDMWANNALTPNGATSSGDPCGKIIPEGAWRLPTSADFVEFISTIPILKKNLHFYSDVAAIGVYNNSNPGAPYVSKFVTFERSGRITSTSNGSIVDYGANNGIRLGFYWSSTPLNNLYAIVGTGALATFAPYTDTAGLTTTHASVRCVRTSLYNNP